MNILSHYRKRMYVVCFRDHIGEWRWQLRAGNHQIIAISGEGYIRKRSCQHIFTRLFPGIRVQYIPL